MSKTYEILDAASRLETVPSGVVAGCSSANSESRNNAIKLFQQIEASFPKDDKRIVQFIGSKRGEGVSRIVFELAKVTAEQLGKSVLLLYDGRFQSPLSSLPSHQTTPILDGFARIDFSSEALVCRVSSAPLFVADFSAKPSIALAQTFTSSRMPTILGQLRKQFDLVLIDSPSLEVCADGLVIAPRVDGVVLVVEAERTPAPVARKAKESIIQCGGNLLGIVFNRKRYYIPDWLYRRL